MRLHHSGLVEKNGVNIVISRIDDKTKIRPSGLKTLKMWILLMDFIE